jgi:hypothetical protein
MVDDPIERFRQHLWIVAILVKQVLRVRNDGDAEFLAGVRMAVLGRPVS